MNSKHSNKLHPSGHNRHSRRATLAAMGRKFRVTHRTLKDADFNVSIIGPNTMARLERADLHRHLMGSYQTRRARAKAKATNGVVPLHSAAA